MSGAGCIWISAGYGGLAETEGEAIRYRVTAGAGATGPVVLAGPTCDSVDIIFDEIARRTVFRWTCNRRRSRADP